MQNVHISEFQLNTATVIFVFLFLLSIVFRFFNLLKNLVFGLEQGIDSLVMQDMVAQSKKNNTLNE